MSKDNVWTREQNEAIKERDCNLLVSAAAGAGKTAVLVERIISLVTDEKKPAEIDRLLVMTFTNAAAYEMKQRIADRLIEELRQDPDSVWLQTQLTLLNNANIKTIDSFCLDVVKNHFSKIDIDPNFRVAEEAESELMKSEAIEELFDEQYENENNFEFIQLLEMFGETKNDIKLQKIVLDVYNFVQSTAWPQEWLEKQTQKYNLKEFGDFAKTDWGAFILDSAKSDLDEIKANLDRTIVKLKDSEGLEPYLRVIEKDANHARLLLEKLNSKEEGRWDPIVSELAGIRFDNLPAIRKKHSEMLKEEASQLHGDLKDSIRKMRERGLSFSSKIILENFSLTYNALSYLVKLVNEFSVLFTKKKSKKSILDFSDLEHYCLQILTISDENGQKRPSDAALDYRAKFSAVLIDEYQDSNLVQEEIIRMVSKADEDEPNLFMVGDVKQSIYRFRHADPDLFMEKYRNYPEKRGGLNRKILLSLNFRSRAEIIDTVNFIFTRIMSEKIGELDYKDKEALHAGAAYPDIELENSMAGGITELHIIDTKQGAPEITDGENNGGQEESQREEEAQPDEFAVNSAAEAKEGAEEDEDGEEERLDSMQCEAKMIACLIKELMKPDEKGKYFHVFDKAAGKYRKVQYRDIVVLSRSIKTRASIWTEEFNSMDIPAFADTGTGFFGANEVQIVLSLLRIIDNPLQDIPLLSVLRSPIFAFTSDELALLRLEDRKVSLYEALVSLASRKENAVPEKNIEQVPEKTIQKASLFINNLERWRRLSVYMPTDQLLWMLYNETGYFEMASAMRGGEQRRANLRILFEKARQYEETSYKGLFSFVNFMDRLIESDGDLGSAKILGENDNVVRIMSIHKSKGLEFPVVFLSGCGTRFNLQDLKGNILMNKDMGFGIDAIDVGKRVIYSSPQKGVVKEINRLESLSEEMRILYVGMTRAREKLIITGVADNLAKKAEKWIKIAGKSEERISPAEVQKSNTYLGWILPSIIRRTSEEDLPDKNDATDETIRLKVKDASICKIRLWNKKDLKKGKYLKSATPGADEFKIGLQVTKQDAAAERKIFDAENTAAGETVDRVLNWIYPNIRASSVPAKITVSELKRMSHLRQEDEEGVFWKYESPVIRKPSFLEKKKGLSAAEKGTVMHFIMQHLDYFDIDLGKQIENMVKRDLLTAEQAKSADLNMIRGFLESALGRRMLASGVINREVPFNIEIPWNELFKEIPVDETYKEMVLLQGVIDCYFIEDGEIVLLDYKTDYVSHEGSSAIKEKYAAQIGYYAHALESLTGKHVKNKYIFLLRTGEILEY